MDTSYHIASEDEYFVREGDTVYRKGKVYRSTVDKKTGNVIKKELLRENYAKVMYDTENLEIRS